jgi:hypothetical protein
VWGSGCINPRFLDLGTSWRWGRCASSMLRITTLNFTSGIFNTGFKILTVVIMKSTIFWNVIPCSLIEVRRIVLLPSAGSKTNQATIKRHPPSRASTLMIETVCSSETPVNFNRTIRRHIPDDCILRTKYRWRVHDICSSQENFQSAKVQITEWTIFCS